MKGSPILVDCLFGNEIWLYILWTEQNAILENQFLGKSVSRQNESCGGRLLVHRVSSFKMLLHIVLKGLYTLKSSILHKPRHKLFSSKSIVSVKCGRNQLRIIKQVLCMAIDLNGPVHRPCSTVGRYDRELTCCDDAVAPSRGFLKSTLFPSPGTSHAFRQLVNHPVEVFSVVLD